MSLHLGNKEICEITYVNDLGVEVTVCEVAIGYLGVFGCPTAPTVSKTTSIYTGGTYYYKLEDFIKDFTDGNGDSYLKLKVVQVPLIGSVRYNGVKINSGYELLLSNIGNLTYTFPTGHTVVNEGYLDAQGNEYLMPEVCMRFAVSDDSVEQLYSEPTTMCLLLRSAVVEEELNLPPTIGDIDLTVEMDVVTPITMEMILELADPRYLDPENDPMAALRVNTIAPDNLGIFYVNNFPIFAGQIITVEEIQSGLFKYVGYNDLSDVPDSFDFSVRDTKGNWSE